MRVLLDKTRCMGSGGCVLAAEDVFAVGPEGIVELRVQPDEELRERVEAAVRGCPGAVISIVEDVS
ncbi:MAG: ferredoxin [Pseudomonadota bacterium]|nr:ferredoxin [Pseudomonadota bacterium]